MQHFFTPFQIHLERRPLNKLTTASAKSEAFLNKCYSRPVSALPTLNFDKVMAFLIDMFKAPYCFNDLYVTIDRWRNLTFEVTDHFRPVTSLKSFGTWLKIITKAVWKAWRVIQLPFLCIQEIFKHLLQKTSCPLPACTRTSIRNK